MRFTPAVLVLMLLVPAVALADPQPKIASGWERLNTEASRGKQDDVYFPTPEVGFYVNGTGRIYKTVDGGDVWKEVLHKPGTYFRCIVMLDERVGFAGNIGTDYFPNVTDTTPLYRTDDGGATWNAVEIQGDPVTGLCALEVVREPIINAGQLGQKTTLVGVGRVGGPAVFIRSDDEGKTWHATSLKNQAGMALDVHFFDRNVGLIAAASSENLEVANALLIRTEDGGKTWTRVYQSDRPFETTWKMSFPTRDIGYVTIQSYNPNPAASKRFVAKTTDNGKTFTELPLVDQHGVREFGVAFLNENRGWVGAMPSGFETLDGGTTWTPVRFGNAVNKLRVVRGSTQTRVYAIGVELHRLTIPNSPK